MKTKIILLLFFQLAVSSLYAQHNELEMKKHSSSDTLSQSKYAKEYSKIMIEMHTKMSSVATTMNDDLDFLKEMIPHHQGAIDMAKAILQGTKDKRIQNLALGIITEQQNEINIMKQLISDIELKSKQHEN
ncbi:DUF305 domain-containing protein [Flavobacterium cellulosilyticum]|uniref:DUF305 domain-containing protein n=1 Tax=Flavobacterium cellulosilyticum TaxID=2541731 RepID=A0A4R5CBK1_9FLAO|nr:DUF305 domain-containing protein [Flavobacterium cellulosilyticum]TDD96146.1 DUF305 domain-containing protein [Flavobacterium cellulosilyticum]